MDTHHLHTGIEEEDTTCQDEVIEIREVGEETILHRQVVVSSRGEVDYSEDDEQTRRDDRTDNTTPLTHLTYPAETLERDERSNPIDGQNDNKRKEPIRGQCSIGSGVHTDKGDAHSTKGKHRGIPNRRLDPLQPNGKETCSRTKGLTNPAEDTALLISKHSGKLSRNHRRRDKEDNGCEEVVECRLQTIDGLSGQTSKTYHSRNIHYGQRHHTKTKGRRLTITLHNIEVLIIPSIITQL